MSVGRAGGLALTRCKMLTLEYLPKQATPLGRLVRLAVVLLLAIAIGVLIASLCFHSNRRNATLRDYPNGVPTGGTSQ